MGLGMALLTIPLLFAFMIYCFKWYGVCFSIILVGLVYALFSDKGISIMAIGKLGIIILLLYHGIKFLQKFDLDCQH